MIDQAYGIALFALIVGLASTALYASSAFSSYHERQRFEKDKERLERRIDDLLNRLMARDLGEWSAATGPEGAVPSGAVERTRTDDEAAEAFQMFGDWEPPERRE